MAYEKPALSRFGTLPDLTAEAYGNPLEHCTPAGAWRLGMGPSAAELSELARAKWAAPSSMIALPKIPSRAA